MRVCPLCCLALRTNDPGASLQVGGDRPGFYAGVCSDCAALHNDIFAGQAALVSAATTAGPVAPDYGALSGPRQDVPAGLCGVCRRYAREDERMMGLRLRREDLSEEEAARLIPPQDDAAHYIACGECRRKYAPAILARLKREKLVPEALTAGQMGPPHFA